MSSIKIYSITLKLDIINTIKCQKKLLWVYVWQNANRIEYLLTISNLRYHSKNKYIHISIDRISFGAWKVFCIIIHFILIPTACAFCVSYVVRSIFCVLCMQSTILLLSHTVRRWTILCVMYSDGIYTCLRLVDTRNPLVVAMFSTLSLGLFVWGIRPKQ